MAVTALARVNSEVENTGKDDDIDKLISIQYSSNPKHVRANASTKIAISAQVAVVSRNVDGLSTNVQSLLHAGLGGEDPCHDLLVRMLQIAEEKEK